MQDINKKNNRYIHVYTSPYTYKEFRTKCPDDLFRQLTISDIKYNPNRRYDKFRDFYSFMISTHIKNTDSIYDVMKQFELWRQKFQWNYLPTEKVLPQKAKTLSNIIESLKKHKQEQAHPQTPITSPVAPSPQTTNSTTTSTQKSYEITDLTPQMVEELLNMQWHYIYRATLYGYHFYHTPQYNSGLTTSKYQDKLNAIQDNLDKNPLYDGRKLAFIARIPNIYTGTQYTHTPRHASQIDKDDDISDIEPIYYSTFISYNPKTKQFEKYPRGWIKIKPNAGFDTIQQHIRDNITEILSAFNKEKQNTR